ncbi:CocE/NonD family hydrolase [Luteimonas sp. RD2P54]|uniref:CocE/NonD family hydrolase n=1 Tax=Luteimonas endophytica TaxID=3042023 RepID=A0ABT6JAK3_9GAMM|nr:CocE/NonD family hydrolase [Luteimonas endophytica]MDH5823610.1 CocE/NonD family hydrolase [Luteimonas endophytica]
MAQPTLAAAPPRVAWEVPADAGPDRVDAALARISREILDEDGPGAEELTAAQRSQLEIVAGRHLEALETIGALVVSSMADGEADRAQRWVPYLLLAEARATPGRDFELAYADAFRARFAGLNDVAALQTHYWLVADVEEASDQLREAVAGHGGEEAISRGAALELVRQAAFVQAYRAAGALAPALVREDEERRFLIDDETMIPGGEDGVVLSAHVVRSRAVEAPVPAAMLFTIYADPERNRAQAMHAAARGYAGVVVDARGKRLGTGDIAPYEHEGEDAHAAIDWISRQPWCDGRVAMYGGSYSGFAAWAAAGRRPRALKAIAPYVASIPGLGLPMENNVFLSANYAWPFYVATNRLLDRDTYGQRGRWAELAERWYASGRPYREIDRIDGTPNPWLQRWLSHPAYDAYWKAMVPDGEEFARISIPVLSITGYFDDAQVSALHYFKEHYRHLPGADHALLIGPYDHFGTQGPIKPMRLRGYALDPSAQFDTLAITFQWFDHVLRGAERPPLLAGRVNYQLMGADRWGHAASLDEAAGGYATLYLSGEGEGERHRLSRHRPRPGHLTQVVDLADRNSSRHGYYPSPIVRDTLGIETGLAFASEVFEQSIDVVGTLSGELKVRTNKRDFDFTVVLYELMEDGRAMQLSYYLGRASHAHDMSTRRLLEPGDWTVLPFERSRMTGRRMAPGSRLLVVVDVVKDAMHQVNHGTGGDVSDESIADAAEPLRVDWHSDSVIRIPMRPNAR